MIFHRRYIFRRRCLVFLRFELSAVYIYQLNINKLVRCFQSTTAINCQAVNCLVLCAYTHCNLYLNFAQTLSEENIATATKWRRSVFAEKYRASAFDVINQKRETAAVRRDKNLGNSVIAMRDLLTTLSAKYEYNMTDSSARGNNHPRRECKRARGSRAGAAVDNWIVPIRFCWFNYTQLTR